MRVDSIPNFFVVIPGIHSNGREVAIYRIQDVSTRQIVRQIPSEQEIHQKERLRESVIKTLEKWA
ncbi:hypothetical protein KAW50_01695 [candidate division WOR-3 bacterium]|nr:hypothetical protein [candidate division WOR-3 bacterium]